MADRQDCKAQSARNPYLNLRIPRHVASPDGSRGFSKPMGVGFIRSDGEDILLRQTVVTEAGLTGVIEGRTVVCDVVRKITGSVTIRILSSGDAGLKLAGP